VATYRGTRRTDGRAEVTVDGVALDPRHDLVNHSPDGFEWGYAGSGPAQLALAILAHHFAVPCPVDPRTHELGADETTPAMRAIRQHQRFKFAAIGALPRHAPWSLTTTDVEGALRMIARDYPEG
jgi:hypothetical protein